MSREKKKNHLSGGKKQTENLSDLQLSQNAVLQGVGLGFRWRHSVHKTPIMCFIFNWDRLGCCSRFQ